MGKRFKGLCLVVLILLGLCSCGQQVPTWQEQYDLGVRYLSEGNYEEAIIAFTAAIEIDPKQAPAYVGRGNAYIKSGETEENLTAARADYEKAIELDETYSGAYLGLADVYISQGNTEKALEILRKGLSATGDDPSIAGRLSELDVTNDGQIVSIYGDESEMARLLREGDTGNLPSIDELNFYGADYHGLSIDTAEALLHQNGFYTQRTQDTMGNISLWGSMRMERELLFGPAVSISRKSDQSYVSGWSYGDAWREEDREPLSTGIRDICIGDSLETVLRKLGFTTAEEIAQLATEYYSQEFTQREDLKAGIEDWRYTTWKKGLKDQQKNIRMEFSEPLIQGGNFLENGHLVVNSIEFFISLAGDETYDSIYIPFEFENGRLTFVTIIL